MHISNINERISNINEGTENGYDDFSMEKFPEMVIKDSLGIQLDSDAIQRAHRVGPKSPGKKQDVIVYFLRYQDKERVRRAAPKKTPNFMGQRIYYNEGFSTVAMEKRKVLSQEMRKRWNEG